MSEKNIQLSDAEIDQLARFTALKLVIGPMVAKGVSFMLGEPQSYTCFIENQNGYAYFPHIGGEVFKLRGGYCPEGKKMVLQFSPCDAAPYSWMEMTLDQAEKALTGFSKHLASEDISLPNLIEKERVKLVNKEIEKMEGVRKQHYNEYGSW